MQAIELRVHVACAVRPLGDSHAGSRSRVRRPPPRRPSGRGAALGIRMMRPERRKTEAEACDHEAGWNLHCGLQLVLNEFRDATLVERDIIMRHSGQQHASEACARADKRVVLSTLRSAVKQGKHDELAAALRRERPGAAHIEEAAGAARNDEQGH
eukprot:2263701-Prymnesium_polylepis.1